MKRLSSLLIVCILGLTLAGCGEDKEKKFTDKVETNLQTIENDYKAAVQAKGSLDADLTKITHTSDQLRDQIASLRSSVNQLNASLSGLQDQIDALKSARDEYKKASEGGSFWKWLFILLVLVAVVLLIWKFIKPPKPFDEEEEEDFSAFDEELGYEEPAEDIGGEDSDSGSKSVP